MMACLGIEYLCENNLLKHDPKDVAQFLYKGEGLNKTAMGKKINGFSPQISLIKCRFFLCAFHQVTTWARKSHSTRKC